ncbi:MAG: HEAT repeat domain-containing protein [Brevibacterium sp.]|uniref:HEAT repeat domain-containing protein n=1 Tax=Brevibacterium sandarakinum TaxID=629680 RepID=UPI00264DA9A9|nr:HEAT repeat domain-containing protein [Brevibacterium sandarakinum]MDN5585759.1 HEAT repeat domain-containing protein [Brevibacterium sp.]MDN5636300.1 HEAT repeat domain-containing protein [Brevibacterium sp.]MDN5657894.1 HEAT repeat domain-containing protein [Brevibacterium sandarakinum]
MTKPHNTETTTQHVSQPQMKQEAVLVALSSANPQHRLQAALSIGITAEDRHLGALIRRCRIDPDFFVRDMLTWAITRMPAEAAVDLLIAELSSDAPQAQGQALHTLSKIGDPRGWEAMDPGIIGTKLIAHSDTEVARSAWRAAVALVPGDDRQRLASTLVTQLGRGDMETQKSLSRAIVSLGEDLVSVLDGRLQAEEETVRTHAMATREMFTDPDAGFAHALSEAKRVVALGSEASA